MTISELARGGGVGVETVRYYQRRGLLFDPRARATGVSGIRHYGDEELRRLRFVRSAARAGFTLDEIGRLIELDAVDDRADARAMASERIAALDTQIAELSAARHSLERLARACAGGPAGPCPILSAFEG